MIQRRAGRLSRTPTWTPSPRADRERDLPGRLGRPGPDRGVFGARAAGLDSLAEDRDLLARQVLIAVREPTANGRSGGSPTPPAPLPAAGVAVTPLCWPPSAPPASPHLPPGPGPPARAAVCHRVAPRVRGV